MSHINRIVRPAARSLLTPASLGRGRVRDNMMTYSSLVPVRDTLHLSSGRVADVHPGQKFDMPVKTRDGRVIDSTGAFLIGELERLDQTFHGPLFETTWNRDIDLREDVTIADDVSSFTLSTYGSAGGLGVGNSVGTGKSWMGRNTTQITGVGVDISKAVNPMHPWAMELKFDVFELEAAAKLGRPVDQQKFEGIQTKHVMDVDEAVYIGDTSLNFGGMINNALVTNTNNVAAGVSGFTQWVAKTPAEILEDFNTALESVWAAAGFAVVPSRILIPPPQYSQISTQLVSSAGTTSILTYILENNLLAKQRGIKLEILPVKWMIGAGVGGTELVTGTVDRMAVYTKAYDKLRYPMTQVQRTPLQFDGLYHKTTYFCKLGQMEVVYPETVGYFDGI